MNVRFLVPARQGFMTPLPGTTNRPTAWEKSSSMNWTGSSDESLPTPYPQMEIEPGLRRSLLARFPYGIIFGLDGDTVVVVAAAHLLREPRYRADLVK